MNEKSFRNTLCLFQSTEKRRREITQDREQIETDTSTYPNLV